MNTIEDIKPKLCCVCGHPLDSHIEEQAVWRCQIVGGDGFQCECGLNKARAFFDKEYYCLHQRVEKKKNGEFP